MFALYRSMTADQPALRHQLRWVTIAWIFGSVWMWTITGAAMTQFARGLGTPDWGFGVMAALPFIATFVQLPASWWTQRYGHRRRFFMVALIIGRALWVAVAALPWILPGQQAWAWTTMLALLAASWVLSQAGGPAWMNWMSDVVPRRVRGVYFARRNLFTRPVAVAAVLGTGWLLDAGSRASGDPSILLRITSGLLAIAGLLGVLDILCFRWVKDPNPPRPDPAAKLFSSLLTPLRDRQIRIYIAYNFTFMLGIGFVGQYVWLYVLDVCGWSNLKANLLVIAVPLLLQMMVVGLWGRLIDRLGKKPVLVLCTVGVSFGSLGWLVITDQNLWLGYSLILLTTLIWPGLEIANFNVLLDLAGTAKKKRGDAQAASSGGTAAVALNSVATAAGGTLSGLLGGALAGLMRDLHWAVPMIGIVLTYHGVLFLISSVLRAVALVFALQLTEPRAKGTREALQMVTSAVYSNVRQAVFLPTRVTGKVLRASYRVARR